MLPSHYPHVAVSLLVGPPAAAGHPAAAAALAHHEAAAAAAAASVSPPAASAAAESAESDARSVKESAGSAAAPETAAVSPGPGLGGWCGAGLAGGSCQGPPGGLGGEGPGAGGEGAPVRPWRSPCISPWWGRPPTLTLTPRLVSGLNTDMNNGHADWRVCCCMVLWSSCRWCVGFMEHPLHSFRPPSCGLLSYCANVQPLRIPEY